MKMAGIPMPKSKKKKEGLDYNKEIPFLRKAAPGLYPVDFDAENERATEDLKGEDIETDGKRQIEEEEENRKKDTKKIKLREKQDLPGAISQVSRLNDPMVIQSKSRLNLPAPQLTNEMLEEIARNESDMNALVSQFDDQGTNATK
jgi:pre-mRNA-splicing factor CDC5/CEF1